MHNASGKGSDPYARLIVAQRNEQSVLAEPDRSDPRTQRSRLHERPVELPHMVAPLVIKGGHLRRIRKQFKALERSTRRVDRCPSCAVPLEPQNRLTRIRQHEQPLFLRHSPQLNRGRAGHRELPCGFGGLFSSCGLLLGEREGPTADHSIGSGGDEGVAVGGELQRGDRPGMRGDVSLRRSAGDVPDPDDALGIPRGEESLIVSHRQHTERLFVVGVGSLLRPVARPQPSRQVVRDRGQTLSVRERQNPSQRCGVALHIKRRQRLLPKANCPVLAAGGIPRGVGMDRHIGHGSSMPRDSTARRAIGHVEYVHAPIIGPGCEPSRVRRHRMPRQLPDELGQLARRQAGGHVDQLHRPIGQAPQTEVLSGDHRELDGCRSRCAEFLREHRCQLPDVEDAVIAGRIELLIVGVDSDRSDSSLVSEEAALRNIEVGGPEQDVPAGIGGAEDGSIGARGDGQYLRSMPRSQDCRGWSRSTR